MSRPRARGSRPGGAPGRAAQNPPVAFPGAAAKGGRGKTRGEAGGWTRLALPALAGFALATGVAASGLLGPAELLVRDAVLRAAPIRPATRVAAVLVDEEAIRRAGPWPWPRARLALLVDAVRAAGARGVAVDLLLPDAREGDEELAAALSRGPSVLAAAGDDRGGWLLPAPLLGAAAGAAHVVFDLDRDGVVRRVHATRELGGRPLTALPVAAARLLDEGLPVPVGRVLRPGFRAGRSVPAVGASELLGGAGAPGVLRGRLVVVGASAAGIGDRVVSPVSSGGSPQPGALVQAATAEAILTGDLLRPAAPLSAGGVAGLLVLVGEALRRRLRRAGALVPAAVVLLPLPLAAAALLLARVELPAVAIGLAALVVATGSALGEGRRLRRATTDAAARVRELEALSERLDEARRADAEARRVVAHELRTPLTSVRGLAQLLSGFDLSDAERKRVAGLVAEEASRLSEMVEALLDLERLKLRELRSVAVPVDLSRLVAGRLSVLGEGSGRDVRASLADGLLVLGDAALLSRVVDNLVGNALKFAPASEPVDVTLRRSAPGRVELSVRDRGPGVPAAERREVFRRFARGSGAAVPGLGLGLALVAEVAAWHGGAAACGEAEGGGSLFTVTLPAAEGPGGGERSA